MFRFRILAVAIVPCLFLGSIQAQQQGVPNYPFPGGGLDPMDDPSLLGPGAPEELIDGLFPGQAGGAIDYSTGTLPGFPTARGKGKKGRRKGGGAAAMDPGLQGLAAALTGKPVPPKVAERNALLVAAITARIPPVIMERLRAGSITREEARQIVEYLTLPVAPGAFAFPIPEDAELMTRGDLEEQLDKLVGHFISQTLAQMDGEPPEVLDTLMLRTWFTSLDPDGNDKLSFLEFRDGTPFGLDVFQGVDRNRDGLIDIDEFAPQIVAAMRRRGLAIHEGLADWISRAEAEAPLVVVDPAAAVKAPPREVQSAVEFILNRARAQLGMAPLESTTEEETAGPIASVGLAELGLGSKGPSTVGQGEGSPLLEGGLDLELQGADRATELALSLYPETPPRQYLPGWDPLPVEDGKDEVTPAPAEATEPEAPPLDSAPEDQEPGTQEEASPDEAPVSTESPSDHTDVDGAPSDQSEPPLPDAGAGDGAAKPDGP